MTTLQNVKKPNLIPLCSQLTGFGSEARKSRASPTIAIIT